MSEKVAIFLDVENLSGWLKADGGDILLDRSLELGRVAVRRAYGNFSVQSVSIRQSELNLLGFEFVHVYHPVKGKNSADIQIVVDVMEYVSRIPDLKWFVLATGDSDFSPLFRRLRELGKSVVGVGPRSALSEAVKKSCNRFIYIDSPAQSESAASLKAAQLREDALELLERVLSKQSEGVNLSMLKHKMLEIDSAFDESNVGFNGFKKFLQSAPEVVTLYQVKNIWHARASDTSTNEQSAVVSSERSANPPTSALYNQLLRKLGWRSCDIGLLWNALTELHTHFPEGFTRSEEFEHLMTSFGHSRTRGELRAVMCTLYKAGFVTYIPHESPSDESMLITAMPKSKQTLASSVDEAMLPRLLSACASNSIQLDSDSLLPLLLRDYSKVELAALIKQAQNQQLVASHSS